MPAKTIITMKKAFLLTAVCAFLSLTSCQKKGVPLFLGDYSFKISGEVEIQRVPSPFDTVTPSTFTYVLPNEIGQLEISPLNHKSDSVIVVMNYLNGEVIVTHGRCDGQHISLEQFKRNNLRISIDGSIDLKSKTTVFASGDIYNENTIILNLTYWGKVTEGQVSYNIEGDDIKMVASRN